MKQKRYHERMGNPLVKQKRYHERMGNPLVKQKRNYECMWIYTSFTYERLNGIHPNTKNTNAYGSTHPCITKISKVIRSRRATNVDV